MFPSLCANVCNKKRGEGKGEMVKRKGGKGEEEEGKQRKGAIYNNVCLEITISLGPTDYIPLKSK